MAVYSIYKYELSVVNGLEALAHCDESHETPLSLVQDTKTHKLYNMMDFDDYAQVAEPSPHK